MKTTLIAIVIVVMMSVRFSCSAEADTLVLSFDSLQSYGEVSGKIYGCPVWQLESEPGNPIVPQPGCTGSFQGADIPIDTLTTKIVDTQGNITQLGTFDLSGTAFDVRPGGYLYTPSASLSFDSSGNFSVVGSVIGLPDIPDGSQLLSGVASITVPYSVSEGFGLDFAGVATVPNLQLSSDLAALCGCSGELIQYDTSFSLAAYYFGPQSKEVGETDIVSTASILSPVPEPASGFQLAAALFTMGLLFVSSRRRAKI